MDLSRILKRMDALLDCEISASWNDLIHITSQRTSAEWDQLVGLQRLWRVRREGNLCVATKPVFWDYHPLSNNGSKDTVTEMAFEYEGTPASLNIGDICLVPADYDCRFYQIAWYVGAFQGHYAMAQQNLAFYSNMRSPMWIVQDDVVFFAEIKGIIRIPGATIDGSDRVAPLIIQALSQIQEDDDSPWKISKQDVKHYR